MDTITINEKPILTLEETIVEVNKIPDVDVRNFIFMHDQNRLRFLQKYRNLNAYLNNLLIISFMYVYGKYLYWKKNKSKNLKTNNDLKKSSNFMRIITSFEKLYYDFNLSYEFIENMLNDIQILLISNESTKLMEELDIYGDFKTSKYFSTIIRVAKLGRMSIRNQETNIGYLRFLLVKSLEMMPFLLNIDIEHSNINLNFVNGDNQTNFQKLVVTKTEISSYDFDMNFAFLHIKESEQYYYLETITQREIKNFGSSEEYFVLTYAAIGKFAESDEEINGRNLYVLVRGEGSKVVEDIKNLYIFEDKDGVDGFRHKIFPFINSSRIVATNLIKDFNAINFRYIRILALAISDVLDDSGKRYLHQMYSIRNEYKAMFVTNLDEINKDNYLENADDEESGYGWDVVIATLLVEESATKLLQELFKYRPEYFVKIINNLQYRFREEDFDVNQMIQIAKQQIDEEINNIKLRMYGSRNGLSFRKMVVNENQVRAKIQALVIVKKLSELTYANENVDITTKFPLSISSRIKIVDEIENMYDEVGNIDTLKNGLQVLVCQTLKTLYCFYHALFGYAKEKMKFEKESVFNILTANDVNLSQKNANLAFDEIMKEKVHEISNIAKDDVQSIMVKIKELCKICAFPDNYNSYNELLKKMLGREFLLNYGNIACFEDCFEEPIYSKSTFVALTEKIKNAFLYLKDGHVAGTNTYDGVIFPYVAFLDYTSNTRDGYEINHFSVVSNNNDEKDIRVISEYKYIPNQSYYCIPNRFRSNDELKLWIEPIIINYKFVESEMNNNDSNKEK